MLTSAVKQRRIPENENKEQSEISLTNSETQKNRLFPLLLYIVASITDLKIVKRRQNIQTDNVSKHDAKRSKRHDIKK
jgi:hypothetical protein